MNAKDKKPINVLLVEDNPGDILLMKEVLNERDNFISLNIIKDGAEAMEYLRNITPETSTSNFPDIIILDLNLPKKNGREILANIRSDSTLKGLPVIIFTSSDAEEDITVCQNLNVLKYYKKPIDFDEYVKTIKAIEKSIETIMDVDNR